MYLSDLFYKWLDFFPNRRSIIYRYTYKVLKVILNITFPLIYKNSVPQKGQRTVEEVVVSFTSFPDRINTVWETAYTLLNQSVVPTHVILWLAGSQFESRDRIPQNLLRLEKHGLEIRFCDDLKSHKKYYYAMTEYPDAIVVTADDDVFYPSKWLEHILEKHYGYPDSIVCYWAHRIKLKQGKMTRYEEWESSIDDGDKVPSELVLPVGYAGVLYPPHVLDDRAFDRQAITDLALSADDLWLKAMAFLNGVHAIQVFSHPVKFFSVIPAQKMALFDINVGQGQNDAVINRIMGAYGELHFLRPMQGD